MDKLAYSNRWTMFFLIIVQSCAVSGSTAFWNDIGSISSTLKASSTTPPGSTTWPYSNPYGGKNPPMNSGSYFLELAVNNTVGENDAYIEQTITGLVPKIGSQDNAVQQFFYAATVSSASTMTAGAWFELRDNGDPTDTGITGTAGYVRGDITAGTSWNFSYKMMEWRRNATAITMRIGVKPKKDGGGNPIPGTRKIYIDNAFVHSWLEQFDWKNYDFETVTKIVIEESDGMTIVGERSGSSDSYNIRLIAGAPVNPVNIIIDPDNQTEVNNAGAGNPVQLTFTSGNWNVPQTVSINGIDDSTIEANPHVSIINHSVVTTDATYQDAVIPSLAVLVTENDLRDCSNEQTSNWPDPNLGLVNLNDLAVLAAKWLQKPKTELYQSAPLEFRAILTSPYDYGRSQAKDFSYTADWDNFLSGWHQEGFNAVVYTLAREMDYGIQGYLRLEEFPLAREISDSTVTANINKFKWVLARAKYYDLDNFIYTASVQWTPAFGTAYGLDKPLPVSLNVCLRSPPYNNGVRNELTRAYTESIFAECARTYEDLDGFYGALGEALPGKKSSWFQEAIAPGLACTGGRQSHKPVFIAHQWHVPLNDYIDDVVNQKVFDNVWLGIHAYNSEIIADPEPWPFVKNWAKETGLPTIVMVYPANIYNMPFNSPKLASEIIAAMRQIPNIKGFFYWDWPGVKLGPLFRKGLAYYGSRNEEYSDEPWLDILEQQFGTREAAIHFLNAFNISARIIPETCALVYGGHDNIRRELQIPFSWFLPGYEPYVYTTSRVRGETLVPVWLYAKMVAKNPALYENANGSDPNHVTGQHTDYRQIPIWRTHGGSSFDVIPSVHMAKIAQLGQDCFNEATLGKAAAAAGTSYQTEAQNMWMFMKGYMLLSKYYQSKVNAAAKGMTYKLGGSTVTLSQAQSAFDAAYNDFLNWYNFVVTESPSLNSVMMSIYGQQIRDDNLGGKTMDGHLTQEQNDKQNWQTTFNTYW